MKAQYYLITCFLILFTISCENAQKAQDRISANNHLDTNLQLKIEIVSDKIFTYSTKVSNREYRLEIMTKCLNDSLSPDEHISFNPIVLEQSLLFYSKDSLIIKLQHPSKRVNRDKYNREKINLPEDVICEIGVINGEDGFFYYITGYGGCNRCSEYNAFYSENGELIWSVYSSIKYEFSEEFGEYEKAMNHYKIPKSACEPNGIKMTKVFPLKKAQNEVCRRLIRKE